MTTVLHIAAHMGGGVGKVLSNVALADTKYKHHIVLLEKPIDTCFTEKLDSSLLTVAPSVDVIEELAGWADIVQFDWWNHPLLAKVMYALRDVQMRSVVWSHTAGCHYPYIKPDFVAMPDYFIFSSRYSMDNPHWSMNDRHRKLNTAVVNSSGGFIDTQNVKLVPHNGFNVGYVGTLGYIKLHPQFVKYCKSISDIPGIHFTMIGRIPEPNLVLRDAEKAGIADKFEFKGYVPDLPAELAKLDVLGYLLNQYHFGTTENAMLEAMSMGIPPVCVNQCAEKYLIQNWRSGFLVNSMREYATCMGMLFQDLDLRTRIGTGARNHVLANLNLANTVDKLDAIYTSVAKHPRRRIPVELVFGKTPYDWYRSGLPPASCGSDVVSKYLVDSTKGSVAQWCKYFPDDEKLQQVVS